MTLSSSMRVISLPANVFCIYSDNGDGGGRRDGADERCMMLMEMAQ